MEPEIIGSYLGLLNERRKGKIGSAPKKYKLFEACGDLPAGLNVLDFMKLGEVNPPSEAGIAFLWKNGDSLHVCGVFEDSDVFNTATEKNEKTWITGDVMEFFFQAHGSEDYYELHLTPENVTLELHLPGVDKLGKIPFESQFYDSGFSYKAERFQDKKSDLAGWYGHMKIPFKGIGVAGGNPEKSRFSVCRYNYNRNCSKPEVSSTSYYPKGGFHQPEFWH